MNTTNPETDPLARLAIMMGIEQEYRDARGNVARTGAATNRRLLAAMGIEAETAQQVDSALRHLIQAEWSHPLPPVLVAYQTNPRPEVPLTLKRTTQRIAWRIDLEDRSQRSGEIDFTALALIGAGEQDLERRRLILPDDLPAGYHSLTVTPGATMRLIVTPGSCWLPDNPRMWGIAVQLYLLRSQANWGIGDYGDLSTLVELAAARGADVIGLNPLHAMFHDDPEHASPYSPASRLLLNDLYIDVTAVPEFVACTEARDIVASDAFQRALQACRDAPLVSYSQVTALKLRVLRLLFEACRNAPDRTRWFEFKTFVDDQGSTLARNCLFLALREHFAAQDESPAHTMSDWHNWPPAYQDLSSPPVEAFAVQNESRIEFLMWLQWISDERLAATASVATANGMAIGLYRDLAIGSNAAGAETWVTPQAVTSDAHVGAPPDIHNPAGQNWGLPPFRPRTLWEDAYRGFIDLLRANMRHAGGLRIDHVMGLQRLYWIPLGAQPSEGAFVAYPLGDLAGILALESHRNRCLVVGEDLGTVPEGFRERMAEANILSYRVLSFERDEANDAFLPPPAYPEYAVSVAGSHDLPTVRGWWEGRDLDVKQRLGLFPGADEATQHRGARDREKAGLLRALASEGLLQAGETPDISRLSIAVHQFLARTPSMLAVAQIDDLTDEGDPVNVPATSDEHPNWRRRLSVPLEGLVDHPAFRSIIQVFHAERPGHQPSAGP